MALIEIGTKYPCSTQGEYVDLEQTEAIPGDIAEMYFEGNYAFTAGDAYECAKQVARIKEDYPGTVIHYFKVEGKRITIQYSVGPVGGSISGYISGSVDQQIGFFWAWWQVAIVLAAIFAFIAGIYALKNGWIFRMRPPTGNITVVARNTKTGQGISGVEITCSYESRKVTTGSSGSAYFGDLPIGTYIFSGQTLEGFYDPYEKEVTVTENTSQSIEIRYTPLTEPQENTATFYISTNVSGIVYVDNEDCGPSPVTKVVPAPGRYVIQFSDVEGYITPEPQTWGMAPGDKQAVRGTYVSTVPWWEKIAKYGLYGLIGIGVIVLISGLTRSSKRGVNE